VTIADLTVLAIVHRSHLPKLSDGIIPPPTTRLQWEAQHCYHVMPAIAVLLLLVEDFEFLQ
jgi:hypothetical protein